ncbi:MAG: hypothetical protein LZF60_160156 [Nitrospira sp.]|nr:MAG: hypothetical protein LZF60_160156 [Nitrospira sp.]
MLLTFALPLHFRSIDTGQSDRNMVPKEWMNSGQTHHARVAVVAGVAHGLIKIEVDLSLARSRPQQSESKDKKGGDIGHRGADSIPKQPASDGFAYQATEKNLQMAYLRNLRATREVIKGCGLTLCWKPAISLLAECCECGPSRTKCTEIGPAFSVSLDGEFAHLSFPSTDRPLSNPKSATWACGGTASGLMSTDS